MKSAIEPSPEGGHLELRRAPEGARHFLLGRPLTHGTPVELLLAGGLWIRGVYEWRGVEVQWPGLRLVLGGPWESTEARYNPTVVAAIHPDAILRWPSEAR